MANAIMEKFKVMGRVEEENVRLRAEAAKLVEAAREGAEQLEKDKAAFEKRKQTEEWAATAQLKQVRSLAKLLSDERKSWKESLSNERKTLSDERKTWKESWTKQNDTLFRVRQELTNAKAANAALVKEKAAADAVAREAKESEARLAKALEEAKKAEARAVKALDIANTDRANLGKTIQGLQAEVLSRVKIIEEVSTRAADAEARVSEVAEARDSLASSLDLLKGDREWLRKRGIGHIVTSILDAPENVAGVNDIKERAREAGFKAGYNRCIAHINVVAKGGYTDERSGFHGVDTEAALAAAVAAYNDTPIRALQDLEECLEAEDYVDRLRALYAEEEAAADEEDEEVAVEEDEEEVVVVGKDGAGSSGTKKD